MIELDGAEGEGGGQILRTALGLSLVTGQPFAIERIRARRANPGLRRQHLTAVKAAAAVGEAQTEGAAPGSRTLRFAPGTLRGGDREFDVGTAGSTTLVLQAVLPALLLAAEPSRLTLRGGTHNPSAPPFDFLQRVFLPALRRLGAEVRAELVRPGFFPAGGGILQVTVEPAPLRPLAWPERGRIRRRLATALVANLPAAIAERELAVVAKRLGWRGKELVVRETADSAGPGNVLSLLVESEHAAEVATGFGELRVPAETVARRATTELTRYLRHDAPVGEHLADQLLVPVALAGGGSFRTLPVSSHFVTNAAVVERFLPVSVDRRREPDGTETVTVAPR